MISLDTECTGLNIYSGCRPYLITTCDESGKVTYWEWDVDPLTRLPVIPKEDIKEIQNLIEGVDRVIMHNSKYDSTALKTIGISVPWEKVDDTLIGAHLLASNQPHNLTDLAMHYLGVDIAPHEVALKEASSKCRNLVRSDRTSQVKGRETSGIWRWRIAAKGLPEMPSAGHEDWKADGWLPRAVARHLGYPEEHEYHTVLSDYANKDSEVTLLLGLEMSRKMRSRGLEKIYRERLRLLPIAQSLEERGVTLSGIRLREMQERYSRESEELGQRCIRIAEHCYDTTLTLPKGGGRSDALSHFIFDVMKLSRKGYTESGKPSLDKNAMEAWELSLKTGSPEHTFISSLSAKRLRDKALGDMRGYERYWQPLEGYGGWYLLHPNLNITGTAHLRWSSSSPNEQNISKKESFNLRYAFGPAPGREWYSLDASNIELRIMAYEAGEGDVINIFERPADAPYYGSYHLVIFDLFHPEKFKQHGKRVKDDNLYGSTWYQWVKNFNYALAYGAQEAKADATARVKGAYQMVRRRFPNITALSDRIKRQADKTGLVETIPDREVDPERGYPILASRTEYGRVSPTTPLNYHVSGTACWWMARAMVKVYDFLEGLNRGDSFQGKKWPGGYYITLQVHDEIDLDCPKCLEYKGEHAYSYNLPVVREVQRLMESCGPPLGVPTPVSVEYHEVSWDKGVSI